MKAKSIVLQDLKRGTVSLCPVGTWVSAGRSSSSNEVVCKDKHVSRNHCRLLAEEDGRLRVVDRSSYGSWVNRERVGGDAYAQAGDELILGTTYVLKVIGLLDPELASPAGSEPVTPQWLGAHHLLLREVGRGGMGIVYEGWDAREERRVAVKWLREAGQKTEEAVERFKREVQLQTRLRNYPGVVKVFELAALTGSTDMFCVMEFVDGSTLLDRLREGLSEIEGAKLLGRVARAVDYMHEEGIIHRDIKPGNVLLTGDGSVRLTDFGIARAVDLQSGTLTGVMLGTPGYMSPEQIKDSKRADFETDIYALGAVLYTILTKKLPVRGKTVPEVLRNVQKGKKPRKPSKINKECDKELEAIALKALSHDPKDRHESAAEFAEELEAWATRKDPKGRVSLFDPSASDDEYLPTLRNLPKRAAKMPPTRRSPPIV